MWTSEQKPEQMPSKPTAKMKFHRKLSKFREFVLEDQASFGLGGPPNNWRGINVSPTTLAGDTGVKKYFARFNNDAGEVWIGCEWEESGDQQWKFYCTTNVFRQLALWYLWRWAWGEWFGLRRKLFYWDLSRRVNNRFPARDEVSRHVD